MKHNEKPLIDDDGEIRELTAEDMAKFRPIREVLPADFVEMLLKHQAERKRRKAVLKVSTTIRFDPDVLEGLRATGKGWQTRVNNAMREWLNSRRDAA